LSLLRPSTNARRKEYSHTLPSDPAPLQLKSMDSLNEVEIKVVDSPIRKLPLASRNDMLGGMESVPELARNKDLASNRASDQLRSTESAYDRTHLFSRDDTLLDSACESLSALLVVAVVTGGCVGSQSA
jgi:hypothetical protein